MTWNPDRYEKFKQQRSAPFYDLLKLVEVRPALNVIDLGCGTGELTRVLADTLPDAQVLGLDLSPNMLARASSHARPGLRFEVGDQSTLSGRYDLIFSNAALQWTEDHQRLIPHLYGCLATGGQIAVQIPSNHTHISHRLIIETAREEPYRSILQGWVRTAPVLGIEDYGQMFFDLNAEDIIAFEKIYPHVLKDADAVLEWISGTALIPYFERLDEHKAEFIETLRTKLHIALPSSPLFYPFKRILFSAKKPF